MTKGRKHVLASVKLADKLGRLADKTEDVAQGLRCMRAALANEGMDCDDYIRGQVNVLLGTAEDASMRAAGLTEEAERELAALRKVRQEARTEERTRVDTV